jgi:hypothetical protein
MFLLCLFHGLSLRSQAGWKQPLSPGQLAALRDVVSRLLLQWPMQL